MSLDVLRGFAIAGIFPLNSVSIWITAAAIPEGVVETPGWTVLRLFFQGHFLPLFSLLFGLSFGMLWRSGRDTRFRPRAALARRAAFLVILGLPHQILAPGEALLIYGLSGLIFLLPSTFLPRRYAAPILGVVGVIGIVAGLAIEAQLFILIGLQLRRLRRRHPRSRGSLGTPDRRPSDHDHRTRGRCAGRGRGAPCCCSAPSCRRRSRCSAWCSW